MRPASRIAIGRAININRYRFRLTFVDAGVTVEFAEGSRALVEARFQGQSR